MLSAISTAVACGITFSPDIKLLQRQYADCQSNPERWNVLQTEAKKYHCLAPKDGFEPYGWDISPTELNLFSSLQQYTLYKKEKSGINHKNWVLDQDPLIYYLRFKAPPVSNFSDHQARIILHYYTNKSEFINVHFSKDTPLYPLFSSKLNGRHYIDPLLIWCARYNHLFVIEWLLNMHSMRSFNHHNVDFSQMEMIHNQSLLHVLSLYSRIPRYKKLIFRLLSEVNIDVWYLMGRKMPNTVMPSTLSDFYNGYVNMLSTQQFGDSKASKKLLSFKRAIDIYAPMKSVCYLSRNQIVFLLIEFDKAPLRMLQQAIRNKNDGLSMKIIQQFPDLNIYARDGSGNYILNIAIVCVQEFGYIAVLSPFVDPFGSAAYAGSQSTPQRVRVRATFNSDVLVGKNDNRIRVI